MTDLSKIIRGTSPTSLAPEACAVWARNSAHHVYLNWNQYSESDKLLRLGGLLWHIASAWGKR